MTVGTVQRPLQLAEVASVAERMVQETFTLDGARTLWHWKGWAWSWYGEQWRRMPEEWLLDTVLLELADAQVMAGEGVKRLKPDVRFCEQVARVVQAMTRMGREKAPAWMGREACPFSDVEKTISFKDVIVDVVTHTAVERTADFFEPVVLPCNFNQGAECPRWMRAIEEWGGGDPAWGLLLQRVFGYCLMSWRGAQRGPLFYGVIRGGKGVVMGMLQRMLGEAYFGTSVDALVEQFGLDGVEWARVMAINEAGDMEKGGGEKFARTWKNMVGQDPVSVNAKYIRQKASVTLGCVPIISSNEIPTLPNQGRGMSGKLLVLPFENSFLGHEQMDLMQELEREMEGVAAWAMRGAMDLLHGVSAGDPWPVPERAATVMEHYLAVNNPVESFLAARFVRAPGGFVHGEEVWRQWEDWRRGSEAGRIPRTQILARVARESSWGLRRGRNAVDQRGLVGLLLRAVAQDEGVEALGGE